WLWVATNPAQSGAWDDTIAALAAHGVEPFDTWPVEELVRRTGTTRHLAGVCERDAARIQPALLARGLRRVALARGVRIHEGTPLEDLEVGPTVRVRTPRGVVTAERVVLALGAWGLRWSEIRQAMVVVTGDIVYTAPIDRQLTRIGWQDPF